MALAKDGKTRLPFDIEHALQSLTVDEKISLLSGIDFWHTAPVHRLGVKSVRLSDGPNGVRGTRFFNGVPAACLPCGTALAATWNVDLIRKGGELQGAEAIAKGASVILGPTVNIQRSPLGGRGFESYSEDPHLSGVMAAATINGIQSKGVIATIKHFVCNDQEHERQAVNSIMTERALREIYLMPFQIALRVAKPKCLMTAYNRVNGVHASENENLLQSILREEWGFEGMVVSDWFGTYSTTEAIKAGLDLEMPGPTYIRGELIRQALGCRKLLEIDVDRRVRKILGFIKQTEELGIPENAPEKTLDNEETASRLRELACEGIVLLKNEQSVLPFSKSKSVAVIGPNANYAAYCGGGSASLLPYYAVSPLDGIKAKSDKVKYALGAVGWKKLPLLSRVARTKDGKQGLTMRVYKDPPTRADRRPIDEVHVKNSDILLVDYKHPLIKGDLFYCTLEAEFSPPDSGDYDFGLIVAGTGKLFVDGTLVVDNTANQTPGDSFFGAGTREEIGTVEMRARSIHTVHIEFGTAPTRTYDVPGATAMGAGGLRIGCEKKTNAQDLIREAVQVAKEADQVVVCAGLNSDWESEGYDRKTMRLPPHSDELIAEVTAVNKNTAVVVQSGTPVEMPWVSSTNALLQAWYGGNECGNAIADVIFGDVNPSGKLPLSFPHRNEDNPAYLNFRSEHGRVLYGEDVYVGYRFYEKTMKDVLFPFGFGLSYTTFSLHGLEVKSLRGKGSDGASIDFGTKVSVTVSVRNVGGRDGAGVVQCYVSQRNPSIKRPVRELKGFKKVFAHSGEEKEVTMLLDKYAFSYWDEDRGQWIVEKGMYDVSVELGTLKGKGEGGMLVDEICLEKTWWWKGL